MRFIRTTLLIAASLASPARADHIDPYDTVQKIYESFKAGGSYQESRAMFSQALRDARHDGKLDPGFAILYAMYSDLARYDGNPAFALQLADEGIALTLTEVPPDENLKNTLLVSRAYALAQDPSPPGIRRRGLRAVGAAARLGDARPVAEPHQPR